MNKKPIASFDHHSIRHFDLPLKLGFFKLLFIFSIVPLPVSAQIDPDLPSTDDYRALASPSQVSVERIKAWIEKTDRIEAGKISQLDSAQNQFEDVRAILCFLLEQTKARTQDPILHQRLEEIRTRTDELALLGEFDNLDLADPATAEHIDFLLRSCIPGAGDPAAEVLGTKPPVTWWGSTLPEGEANLQPRTPSSAKKEKREESADTFIRPSTGLTEMLPAATPQTPIFLLRFFETTMTFDPYWGSYRSPRSVLQDRCANDLDMARLFMMLLWEMEVPARMVHGRVVVDLTNMETLLRVRGADAVVNVLTAAGAPHEVVEHAGTVTGLRLERFWVEAYLPLSNYRGTQAGTGDHAWIPMDPLFGTLGVLDFDDPFDSTGFDGFSTVLDYETTQQREALPWINVQIKSLAPELDLFALAQNLVVPEPGPNFFELSLPFDVEERLATFIDIPDSLKHTIRIAATDDAGTAVLDRTVPLERLYGYVTAWDAVPFEAADQELIDLYGSRWLVPAHLLRLRPAITVEGTALMIGDRGLTPGLDLDLEVTLTSPSGMQVVTRNPVLFGGFGILAFRGGGNPLDDMEEYLPSDYSPFGNYMFALGSAFLNRCLQADMTLAQAMRLVLVTPTPNPIWLALEHQVQFLNGDPIALDPVGLFVDTDVRTTRVVRSHSAIAEDRIQDFRFLSSMVCAQEESLILENLGNDVHAVAVPDVFKQANALQITVLDLTPEQGSQLDALALPAEFKSVLRDYLTSGASLHLVPQQVDLFGVGFCSAWAYLPDTGQSNWLLDANRSGGTTATHTSSWDPEAEEAAQDPQTDFSDLEPGDVVFLFLDPDTAYQTVTVADPRITIRYRALNSLGRPVENALVILKPAMDLPGLEDVESVSGPDGYAEFSLCVPGDTTLNSWLVLEEPNDPMKPNPELVSMFHFLAETDTGIAGNRSATAVLFPGQPNRVYGILHVQTSAQGTYDSPTQPQVLNLMVVDDKDNLNSNVPITVTSDLPENWTKCLTYFDEIPAGIPGSVPTSIFFQTDAEIQDEMTTYQLLSSYWQTVVSFKAGAANGRGFGGEETIRISASGVADVEFDMDYLTMEPQGGPIRGIESADEWVAECDDKLDYPQGQISALYELYGIGWEENAYSLRNPKGWPKKVIRMRPYDTSFSAMGYLYQLAIFAKGGTCNGLHPCPLNNPEVYTEFTFLYAVNGLGEVPTLTDDLTCETGICGESAPCAAPDVDPGDPATWRKPCVADCEVFSPGVYFANFEMLRFYVGFNGNLVPSVSRSFPLGVVAYAASLTADDLPPIPVDSRNRQKMDVALALNILPLKFKGTGKHLFQLFKGVQLVDEKHPTGPGLIYLKGNLWDPAARYEMRFVFDVDESINPGQSFDSGRVPLHIVSDTDLAVIDIENYALWLDAYPPSSAKTDNPCEFRFLGSHLPGVAHGLVDQDLTINHVQDYDEVKLCGYQPGNNPLAAMPDVVLDLDGQGFGPDSLGRATLPKGHPYPVPNLNQLSNYSWQLVGIRNHRIVAESPLRNLECKFPVEGVGIASENEGIHVFDPAYEYSIQIDPTGTLPSGCDHLERQLGFTITESAVVSFSFDRQVFFQEKQLGPGTYTFDVTLEELGTRTWEFDAEFQTDKGEAVHLHRVGYVDVESKVKSGLRIGDTRVKGVSLTNGGLALSSTDINIPGRGAGLFLNRTYSSGTGQNYSPLGIGWNHSYLSKLVRMRCDYLMIVGGDGSGQVFQPDGEGGYVPSGPGIHSRLVANEEDGFTLITKSGMQYVYGLPIDESSDKDSPYAFEHNLLYIQDPFGNRVTLQYRELDHHLERVTDPAGRALVFQYSVHTALGYPLLDSVTTENVSPPITITYDHDAHGRLTQVSRGERVEQYEYSDPCLGALERNKLIAYTNPNQSVTRYTYHDDNSLPTYPLAGDFVKTITEKCAGGDVVTHFEYDTSMGIDYATVWDGISSTTYAFNFHGQPTLIQGPLGTKTMSWKPDDVLLEWETDEVGRTFEYRYDANGNMIRKEQTGTDYEETWIYDLTWNKPTQHTDPRGNTTTWRIDATFGYVSSTTDAEGNTTRFTIDESNGDLISITDPKGFVTSFEYDPYGTPAKKALPDANEITTIFDSRGRMLSESDRAGRNKTYTYTDLDYVKTIDATAEQSDGLHVAMEYLPMGQITRQIDGVLETTYAYDDLNRVVEEIVNPGLGQPARKTTKTYDIHGNPTQEITTNDMGTGPTRVFDHHYDAADRLTDTDLNQNPHAHYDYLAGTELVSSETDWRGATTLYRYDEFLHLREVELPTSAGEDKHIKQFRFDLAGNKTGESDALGNWTTFEYDRAHRLSRQTNALGHATTFTYDENGNLIEQENLVTGAGLTRQYDELNRMTQETRFNDTPQTTSFSYENFGRTVTKTPPEDEAITFEYNELGQLISRIQAGITVGYTYDLAGQPKQIDFPEEYTASRTSDGLGRKISEIDPHGDTQSWTYDVFGNVATVTDRRGACTTTSYDDYDRPLTRTQVLGEPPLEETATESWIYSQSSGQVNRTHTTVFGNTITTVFDAQDREICVTDTVRGTRNNTWDAVNLLTQTDFRGNETRFETYDPLNRPKEIIDAGGNFLITYDDEKHIVTSVDRKNIVTVDTFDVQGNLLTRMRSGVIQETHVYDRQSRPIESIDGSDRKSFFSYDDLGRLQTETRGTGTARQVIEYREFDDLGRPGEIFDGLNSQYFTYDFYNRILSQTNGLGETHGFVYDPIGNLTAKTTPPAGTGADKITTYSYDILSNLTQVVEPNTATTSYTWTNAWRNLAVQDAEGETSYWTYDDAHRLISIQRPGLGVTHFGYDGNDNTQTIDRPIGHVQMTYDYLDRLMNETWTGNPVGVATIDSITRVRDPNGNVTQVVQEGLDHQGILWSYTRHIDYDAFDRPWLFSDSRGFSIEIGYENNGSRAWVENADGQLVSYTYDAANRLKSVGVGSLEPVVYDYTANGLIQSVTYPNGVTTSWDEYDAANRPKDIVLARPGGESTRYQLDYYPDGSRQQLIESRSTLGTRTTTYTYDDNARLTQWTRTTPDHTRTTTYQLDLVGNRLFESESGDDGFERTRDYTINPGHVIGAFDELVTQDGTPILDRTVTYGYDLNGNRIAKSEIDNFAKRFDQTEFHWDAKNRLRQIDQDGLPAQYFDYDDLDRRIRKSGDSRNPDPILYVWDELAVLNEFSEDLSDVEVDQKAHLPLASYAFGDMRLAMQRPGFNTHWIQQDPLGSTADITEDVTGSLVEALTYDPFGTQEIIHTSGDGGWNRIGFTGHEFDPETNLTYAKARFYDQDLGIFLGQDPELGSFDTPPSLHRFNCAFNNPTRFFDPTGRISQEAQRQEQESTIGIMPNSNKAILDAIADFGEDAELFGEALREWVWEEFKGEVTGKNIIRDVAALANPDVAWYWKAVILAGRISEARELLRFAKRVKNIFLEIRAGTWKRKRPHEAHVHTASKKAPVATKAPLNHFGRHEAQDQAKQKLSKAQQMERRTESSKWHQLRKEAPDGLFDADTGLPIGAWRDANMVERSGVTGQKASKTQLLKEAQQIQEGTAVAKYNRKRQRISDASSRTTGGFKPSGTPGVYDQMTGQGLYVLKDLDGRIQYVGIGDVPKRLAAHARDPRKRHLIGETVYEVGNLTKAQARGLEQRLMGRFGGPTQKTRPGTGQLQNRNVSFSQANRNRYSYRGAVTDQLWNDAIQRIKELEW